MNNFWKNKKVLLIGGAGFIGSHTVDLLLSKDAQVAVIDNFSTGFRSNLASGVTVFEQDATADLSNVYEEIVPDFVMTFVSVVDVPFAIANPVLTCDGIKATVNALEASVKYKVKKFLYASSGFIYGNASLPTSESEPIKPLNPYNIAKACGEHYCSFFSKHYQLPCCVMRYSPVYGPRRKIGPINDYIDKISNGKSAEIYGTKTRDYIFVKDVAKANLLALEHLVDFSVFNIGTGKETDLRRVYSMIACHLGAPDAPILLPSKNSEIDRFVLDVTKAKTELGFESSTELSEGLLQTILWQRENYGLHQSV